MPKRILNCLLVKENHTQLWNRCTSFEYDIFVNSGYIARNPEKSIPQYDRYKNSMFLLCPGDRGKEIDIEGTIRLFDAPDARQMQPGLFPILDLYDKSALFPGKLEILMRLPPQEVVNIGAMAIKKEKRSSDCLLKLMSAFFKLCCRYRYMYAFVSLENFTLYENFKKVFSIMELGPKVLFRGAPSILILIDIFDQLDQAQEENNGNL